ncbi:MAG: 30S ribosomal protein S13 [Candidatus Pacebacteria bacterium]|nr:30S ribosomal protein S13 [Candidatus Paceibacterota bacterium]
MRIFGISLPENKQIQYGMTVLYGIGLSKAQSICEEAGVNPVTKVKDITDAEDKKLRDIIESMNLEGDLKREVSQNIKRLIDIDSYRGNRHSRKLPSRGQRSKTNSRTRRGNKRATMGSGRK